MSKQSLKKFRKNNFYEDNEVQDNSKKYLDKRKEKRFDRALRTRDVTVLLDEKDGIDPIDIEDQIYVDNLSWKA